MSNTLSNISLLSRCFGRFVVHGRADKKRPIKKAAIIQLAQLGDMVCTTPMFRAVKKAYPQAELIVIGAPKNKGMVDHNSDVDRYIPFEKNSPQFIEKLQKENIDFGCLAVPDFSALATLYLAGVPLITTPELKNGRSPNESRAYNILKYTTVRVPYYFGRYFPGQYLKLLEPAGIRSDDTHKHLGFSHEADKKVGEYLAQHGITSNDFLVGVSPSAGNKIKLWPADRFGDVIRHLTKDSKVKVLLVAGKDDAEEAQQVAVAVGENPQFINTTQEFNLDELKAFMSKLNLFISVDTGPIYIAEAFDVPTIDIIGPMDENEQPPIGPKHRLVFLKDRRAPELHITNAKSYNVEEARRQAESITSAMVIEALDDLLTHIHV